MTTPQPKGRIAAAVVRGIVAPLWARWESSPYLRVARELAGREAEGLESRLARQWERLREIVAHAYRETPFYRRRFDEIGFAPEDLREWDDLRRLPVLRKSDIQRSAAELRARTIPDERTEPRKTSGSTGSPLRLVVDIPSSQWKRGVTLYRDGWTGWRLGEWRAALWGNPEHLAHWRGRLRNRLLERMIFLDTLKMDSAEVAAFASRVRKIAPTLLFGHAHSLYLLAREWRNAGWPTFRPRAVLSTAMVLHEHERRLIGEVFECPVFDRYGCEEVSLIASECEAHSGLHVNTDTLVVEVVDADGRPAGPGVPGRVLVTDLTNRAMPVIRYEVGDMAVPAAGSCPCGRSYPLLSRIAGRVADYLVTPEGELISGISLTENFANMVPGIEQMQIVQDRRDHLRIRVVPAPSFGEGSVSTIAELVRRRFGDRMRFDLEKVGRIAPTPGGKYRFTIREIPLDDA
ncbi:MAG: phenylacetate--CoA ligase family protein [Acidobacteria bacterium]|nr:MAG: phenylacetate--CoA ligase family protein [Acidobacteriota bacterium]